MCLGSLNRHVRYGEWGKTFFTIRLIIRSVNSNYLRGMALFANKSNLESVYLYTHAINNYCREKIPEQIEFIVRLPIIFKSACGGIVTNETLLVECEKLPFCGEQKLKNKILFNPQDTCALIYIDLYLHQLSV